MNKVLLLEDEDIIRKQLTLLLERNNYEVVGTSSVEEAVTFYPESFDVILADIRLPGRDGNQILDFAEQVPVIMMTSYASVRSAVESMKLGATDYISKPFDHDELLLTIDRSLRENRLSVQNAAMRRDLNRLYPQIEVDSLNPVMQETIAAIKNISPDDLFVYLQGERGSGKEMLARLCHSHSERNRGPLVFADLPMYESSEIEQLLFGSNQDTHRPSSGLLQAAHGGTLVVRTISALPIEKQLFLATQLVGAKNRRSAPNVRLIVLAMDSPGTAVKENLLHPELAELFGDCVFPSLPLRERRDDIGPISASYVRLFVKRYRKRRIVLSLEARNALQAYQWPGNINELKSVIERAVLMVDSEEIKPVHLGINVIDEEAAHSGLDLSLDAYFRYFVLSFEDKLSETELASKLGISRKALWERRQKMDLPRKA